MKINFAKREAIRFQEKLIYDIVALIFGEEMRSAWISDLSKLTDFRMFNPKRGEDIGNGYFRFVSYNWDMKEIQKELNKKFWELTKEEKDKYRKEVFNIIKKEDLIFDEDIIYKIKDKYNVELTEEQLLENLVNIANYVAQNMKGDIRKEYFQKS